MGRSSVDADNADTTGGTDADANTSMDRGGTGEQQPLLSSPSHPSAALAAGANNSRSNTDGSSSGHDGDGGSRAAISTSNSIQEEDGLDRIVAATSHSPNSDGAATGAVKRELLVRLVVVTGCILITHVDDVSLKFCSLSTHVCSRALPDCAIAPWGRASLRSDTTLSEGSSRENE
jgi:hypothetical protein